MKKATALLLILLMILNTLTFVFADTAEDDALVLSFEKALWSFEGLSKDLLISTMDVYFRLKDENRSGFLSAYQNALGAMSGYGDKLVEFGMSAEIFETLDKYMMEDGKSSVYNAYQSDDEQDFIDAIEASKSELLSTYSTTQLENLVKGLNKVRPKIDIFTNILRDMDLIKILGYNSGTDIINLVVQKNVEDIILIGNAALKLSLTYSHIEGALNEMMDYYNGLKAGADKRLVYSHLSSADTLNLFLERITVSPVSTTTTTISGIGEPDYAVRLLKGTELLKTTSIALDGSYSFTIARQPAGTVLKVELVTKQTSTSILDSKTVTVTQAAVVPAGGGGGGFTIAEELPPLAPINIPVDYLALAALAFDDIDGVPWAHEAIIKLHEKGIIRGKAPRIFDPNGFITRAEFAALTARMFALTTTEADVMNFDDVKSTDWFYPEVKAVFINNIMTGSGAHFNPHGAITRQEIATIIGRILSNNAIALKDPNILATYTDASDIETWAVAGSQLSIQEGIITGRTTTTFAPKGNATRAEVAVILYRMVGKVKTILDVVAEQ